MFGDHIVDVALYPCNSTSGGASFGPLATTCVVPNWLGRSISSWGTAHSFIAASYAARNADSPSGVLKADGGRDVVHLRSFVPISAYARARLVGALAVPGSASASPQANR